MRYNNKAGLVTSHGGHLTEILELKEAFAGQEVFFVTYRSTRAQELRSEHRVYELANIGTNPACALAALWPAWRILRREQPATLISTGAEIAIPFFVVARVLGIRTIFIESWCRVHTASGTGRFLYRLADVFFVQWPQLLAIYGPRARYEGGLL